MIVKTSTQGWEIIFQRAHGLLASKIAFYWQENDRPKRWMETLTAISEHDDGQESWKKNAHVTEAGAPQDFILKEFSLEQATRIAEISKYKSKWIALMISMHMSYLYEGLRGKNKETDSFLDEQLENQKAYRKHFKIKKSEAEAAYRLVHWCDRCSLILCQDKVPADRRKVEVFELPNGEESYLSQREDGSIQIEPWVFEVDEFEVEVEVHCLSKLEYKNDKELANDLPSSEIVERSWIFRK